MKGSSKMESRKKQNQEEIKEKAFVHLVYEFRCLANAANAWKNYGPESKEECKIPEVSTIIQDSLLLHTRNLIEFFFPVNNRYSTDININSFLQINDKKKKEMLKLKKQIEVHVLHLTLYRDPEFRRGGKAQVQRPNFGKVCDKIFKNFKNIAEEFANNLNYPWKEVIKELVEASKKRHENGLDYEWPKNLGEKEDILKYLKGLKDNCFNKQDLSEV